MSVVSRLKKKFYFVAAGYFRAFANIAYRRWRPRVIAVTGSAGKTTMLHLIEKELGEKAHYSHDANSAFGVAFDMVNLRGVKGSKWRWLWLVFAVPVKSLFYRHKEEFYIVEIDGERPREAEFVASWLKPEVSLWISFGLSHAVQFEAQVEAGTYPDLAAAIAHEFATIPKHTTEMVYIDGEVTAMAAGVAGTKARVVKCFKNELEEYSVLPEESDFTVNGTKFHFSAPQPKDLAIQLVMLEKLAEYLKIEIDPDFSDLPMPPGRVSFFEGKGGLKLIDSTYNAHLISMEAVLEMAKAMRAPHRWLVIGDIVDQGSIEKREHEKLARLLLDTGAERIVMVGRRTREYTLPKLKGKGVKVFSTLDTKEVLEYLERETTGRETLIFKGSQYLEWVVEKLLLHPEDAAKLCRREPAAVKRRARRGLT